MTKATITFTHEQAVDFITEKLQDDFSSNFDFIVSISTAISNEPVNISESIRIISEESQDIPVGTSDNPETIVRNPWLVPDEDGWFMHDPKYTHSACPSYIDRTREVSILFRKGGAVNRFSSYADWSVDDSDADIIKWKYAD